MQTINIKKIHPLKRALAYINILTKQRYQHRKDLIHIANQQTLYNPADLTQPSNQLSFCYRLYDCTKEKSIFQFQPYTDRNIGGDSTASLYFDKENEQITLEGYIDTSNKEKLEQYPSIGMALRHPYEVKCGPFNAIKVELDGDGEAIHLGVELNSPIEGSVPCYGIITSKFKGLHSYELPFQNMMAVGAQEGIRGANQYKMPSNSQQFFDRDSYDARRLLTSEAKQAIIMDINLRLLSSTSMARKISVKSIDLVHRAQSIQFLKQYRQPFFYMVPSDVYLPQPQSKVSWLSFPYKQMKTIHLGDRYYKRK